MKALIEVFKTSIDWLKSVWRVGLKIGFDASMPGLERSRIMLLNGISIVTFIPVFIFFVVFSVIGYKYYYGPLYIFPVGFAILFLNYKKKYKTAQVVYLVGSLLVISYWCYEGRGNGNEYTLIALATTSTLIFNRKITVYLCNFLCAGIFLLYKFYDSYYPFVPDPTINYPLIQSIILINSVGVVAFQMAFFRDLVHHYDDKLFAKYKEINAVAEQQRMTEEELKTSNEELKAVNEKLHELTLELENIVKQKSTELQTYIEAINVNMFSAITDLDGLLLMVNEPLIKTSGYSREELIGKHYHLLASGPHQKRVYWQRRKITMAGQTWRGEVEHKSKDGSNYWFDCVVIPIKDEADGISCFLSLGLPITERKLHEQMREKTQGMLETIAFRASHKIRGPLARVKGLVNLIQRDLIDEREFKMIADKLGICSDELSMATSELVSFVYNSQEGL